LRLAAHRLARSGSAGAVPLAGEGATAGGPRPAGIAEVADVIDQEVGRLEELAAQFSALGRPPEGPATAIDMGELVTSVVETDVPPAIDAGLDVASALPPVVGHYDGLFRAFRNLIRNAVEAVEHATDPRVRITVRLVREAGGGPGGGVAWVETAIADNGPGLPAGREDRIFEPDFTTKTRGTGLGLALVRQAIEADGGVVRAASREGGGAELVVLLPAAPSAATLAATRREHESPVR
jgi:two-component system, NtrC family, nitrogen regulation sensor histidine kinase NtrY